MPDSRNTVLMLRRAHRCLGIVLALFIATIAVSGTVLQVIISIYGDTGPMLAPGEPFWVVRLRDLAVTLHTGAFTGIAGVYIGVLCALGLLFFTVSGVWMYLQIYRTRFAQGRKAFFWQSGRGAHAEMRSLHRSITPPFVLFAVFYSITGASLDLYFVRYNTVPLPPQRGAGGNPGMAPRFRGGVGPPRAPGGPPGSLGPGRGGNPPGQPRAGRVWHDVSLSLHKLNFLGRPGHLLGVFLGLALLMLAVSGAWMFTTMYWQRRDAGLSGLFW